MAEQTRVQGDGYTYEPTILPANSTGKTPVYEAKLARGKDSVVAMFQQYIDRCQQSGYNLAGVQSAFNECIPFVFVGDLTNDQPSPEWQIEASEKMNLAVFGVEQPVLKSLPKKDKIKWHNLQNLINLATSFHSVSSEEGDAKVETLLFPAIDEFIASL
jgi:hypothetical protein